MYIKCVRLCVITYIHRGQSNYSILDIRKYWSFYLSCMCILCIHAGISMLRAYIYSLQFHTPVLHYYNCISYDIWIIMIGLSLVGIGLSHVWNTYDLFSYKRYQQFLRLEFDTRLGMHSPR